MVDEIPIETLYKHPLVQALLGESDINSDLERIKLPFIIKDKVLMSPGTWNNYYYSAEALKNAFDASAWDSKEIRSLFLDHEDKRSREWIGEVKNARWVPKVIDEGKELESVIIGDLIIVDKPTAMKLAYGAKMGISPKVIGNEEDNVMHSFVFDNFSVVINPAVKTAYINNSEVSKMEEPKVEEKSEAPIAAPAPVVEAKVEAPVEAKVELAESDSKVSEEPVKEVPPKEEALAENPKVEASLSDVIGLLKELISEMKSLKDKYPMPEKKCEDAELEKVKYPEVAEVAPAEKYPEDKYKKMEEAMQQQEQKIKELSDELSHAEKVLNEPDKVTLKAEELSKADVKPSMADIDRGMLELLKNSV